MKRFIPYIIFAAACLILQLFPLCRSLGYEYSFATALLLTIFMPWLKWPWHDHNPTALPTFMQHISGGMLCAAISLALSMITGLFAGFCSLTSGLLFFALIPVATLLISAIWANTCGHLLKGKKRFFLYYGAFLFSIILSVWHVASEPRIVEFDPFFGYFAGSIYDEAISVFPQLAVYRLINLLFFGSLWFLSRTIRTVHKIDEESLKNTLKSRIIAGLFALLCFIVWIVSDHQAQKISVNVTRPFIEQELGSTLRTEHFIIYYRATPGDEQQPEFLRKEHESRYHFLNQFFHVEPAELPIRSYVYPSAEDKGKLMGGTRTSVSKVWLNEIHVAELKPGGTLLLHELAHTFAGAFSDSPLRLVTRFGLPQMGWVEGLAVAAEWPHAEFTPHEWSAAMIKLGIAPDISQLISPTGFWGQFPGMAYTLVGSYFRWLIDTYGIDKIKRLSISFDYPSEIGITSEESIRQWQQFLQNSELSENELHLARYYFDRPSIFEKHCARDTATLVNDLNQAFENGQCTYAIQSMAQLLTENPDNSRYAFNYIQQLIQLHEYRKAEEHIIALRTSPNLSGIEKNQAKERYADLLWLTGKADDALKLYRELQSETMPMAAQRALASKVYALEHPQIMQTLKRYFLDANLENERIPELYETLKETDDPLVEYLLGLQLYNSKSYLHAATHLQNCADKLPHPLLAENAQFIIAEALYASKNKSAAKVIWKTLAKTAIYSGQRQRAADALTRF